MEDKRYELTPEEQKIWDTRFDEAERVMGKPAADAMRKLYDFYGTDWIFWLGSLYDYESGFIYYANSARDNSGYLPDSESTCQAIGIINSSGAAARYGLDWKKALPAEAGERMLRYAQQMQSDEDGYFYHKQWGNKIGAARRGRDYSQCLEIIRRMAGKPLYPTATERIEALAKAAEEKKAEPVKAEAKTEEKPVFPPHLLSKEAMLEYLKKFDIRHESHGMGHILAAQGSQIVAAGLADFVCDYIDSMQFPDTGLWEIGANYASLSGVIKMGSLYGILGRPIKHGYNIIDSAIEVILSDEDPKPINYVFNPIGGLGTAVGSVAKANKAAAERGEEPPYDMELVRRKIYDRLPEMVDKTIEKLAKFRKPDGSFSFLQKRSLIFSQGVACSLGEDEGDVNGLACAMTYILGSMFGFLGIPWIPMCNPVHFEKFLDMVREAKPTVKRPYPPEYAEVQNFEGGGMSHRFAGSSGGFDITPDPHRDGNSTLKWWSEEGKVDRVKYNATDFLRQPPVTKITAFTYEVEVLLLECAKEGKIFDIELYSNGNTAVSVPVSVKGGEMFFTPCDTAPVRLGSTDGWVKLKLEYYPIDDSSAKTKLFADGVCVAESASFVGDKPLDFVDGAAFVAEEAYLEFLFDNLKCRICTDKTYKG